MTLAKSIRLGPDETFQVYIEAGGGSRRRTLFEVNGGGGAGPGPGRPTNAGIGVADGVEANPGFYFAGDTNSGIYRAGADDWHLVANGDTRIRITDTIVVINEDSGAVTFRVETDGLSNGFLSGSGDNFAFGAAVDAAVFLLITPPARSSAPNAGVGNGLDFNTSTFTDSNTAASGTAAASVYVAIAAPTYAATNTSVTHTDTATVYIDAAPAAGTNVTFTRSYAVWIDAGQLRVDSNLQVNNTALFATTQPNASVVFQSQTAPVGSITTGGALFSSSTVIRKIIADGTASNVET